MIVLYALFDYGLSERQRFGTGHKNSRGRLLFGGNVC
jgi:hypothetical protein